MILRIQVTPTNSAVQLQLFTSLTLVLLKKGSVHYTVNKYHTMARLQKRTCTRQQDGGWVFHENNTNNDANNTSLATMDHPTADLASSNNNDNNTGASASDTKFDYGSDSDDDNEDNTRRDSPGASALHRDGSDAVWNDPSSNNNSPGASAMHRHGSDAIRMTPETITKRTPARFMEMKRSITHQLMEMTRTKTITATPAKKTPTRH
jgi:hypothetical protein